MKKNFKYALLGAIALTGAVGFSACQSSDEIVDNPDYNPETNAVKTEFAFNIVPPQARTRMTSTNTQSDGSFRGMTGVSLISFSGTPADATVVSDGFFPMDDITGIDADNSSKVYTMYIPVTTSNFLFYAKASGTTKGMDQGSLTYNVDNSTHKTPSTISFALNPIVSDLTTITGDGKAQKVLLTYLNSISGVNGWSETQNQALSNAYTDFTSFSAGARQGSAAAILRTVQDLYKTVAEINNGTLGVDEVNLAKAIMDAISDGTLMQLTGTQYAANATISYKSEDTDVTEFPANQKLPAGAMSLACSEGTFSYQNTGQNVFGATSSVNISNICYPAELTYYCNSPLRATTTSKKTSDYKTTVTDWDNASNWSGWTQTSVTESTRAVAMQYNVKYGVALLASTFKVREGTYKDNRAAVTNNKEQDQDIAIDGSSFKVTGIIIGSQPDQATYEFVPSSGDTFSKLVYDGFSTAGTAVTTSGTAANYTLLLDNWASTQTAVNVAVELINEGNDFFGKNGIIGKGQKFYLIAALTPEDGSWTATSGSAGVGYPSAYLAKRVFAQDFKTEANFTIGKDESSFLKEAYSVIPDLRSTQMTFGLSVDLVWKTGLEFDVKF